MKKLTLVLVLGLLLIGTNVNAAATSTIKDKIDQLKADRKELTSQIKETRKEKVGRLASNLVNKAVNSINNIDSLLAKVKDRLTKMEVAGKDVAAAKAKVPAAETAIATAKTTVENLMASLPNVITASSTPKAIRDASKTAVQQAVQEVKKAHQAVVDVIKAIKPGQVKPVTATTTNQ